MGKLQPNFSWQKYEGNDETQKEQFQYQLQQEHIVVANALNGTVSDGSYFSTNRETGYAWVDGSAVWTVTVTGVLTVSGGPNPFNHGEHNIIQVIDLTGTAQDTVSITALSLSVPYVDPSTLANGLGLYATPTQLIVTTGNSMWVGYTVNLTMRYTRVRPKNQG